MLQKLPRTFYERNTIIVAQELLGKYIIHNQLGTEFIGRIVEVEAYLGEHDLGAHSSKGLTPRTKVMFGPAGYAYIYLIYGIYYCTNIVTEIEGTQGPGLLSKALHIDKQLNQHDLNSDNFYIAAPEKEVPFAIVERPRIGIHYAQDWAEKLLRFYIKDNAFISKP
jgi:DNA-3-methyladenine glycosylase